MCKNVSLLVRWCRWGVEHWEASFGFSQGATFSSAFQVNNTEGTRHKTYDISSGLIWTNQTIHMFLVRCLNPCLQGTSVQVVSAQPSWLVSPCFHAKLHRALRPLPIMQGRHSVEWHFSMWGAAPRLHYEHTSPLARQSTTVIDLQISLMSTKDKVSSDAWRLPKTHIGREWSGRDWHDVGKRLAPVIGEICGHNRLRS